MKNLTAMILAIAMLCAVSCKVNTTTPAETTATTTTVGSDAPIAPPETTETTDITTVGEGSALPTETTETVAEPFDAAAFLADCTVYEVNTKNYHQPYKDLEKLDVSDRPEKIALRFTDAEGLTILMELADDGYYYDKHIFNNNISLSIDEDRFAYKQRGYFVEYNNGLTIVQNGENPLVKYHIFKGTDCEMIENDATESGYSLDIYLTDDSGWRYSKGDWEYFSAHSISDLIDVYESEDDFYCEHGSMSFQNGVVVFEPEYTLTIGEYYKSDSFPFRESKKIYGAETFGEYAKKYRENK